MGLLSLFLGWNYRVRSLRKRWDRLREKALKKHGALRKETLTRLDMIESNIQTLEEQNLNRIVRMRMAKEVEMGLEEVKAMLKAKEAEFEEYNITTGKSQT